MWEFEKFISNKESIPCSSVRDILKEYSSMVSIFDMMAFSSHVIDENKYVQESYGENSQKSYVLSFLLRVRVYRTIQIIMQKILIKNHSLMQRLLKLIIQMKLLNLKFH